MFHAIEQFRHLAVHFGGHSAISVKYLQAAILWPSLPVKPAASLRILLVESRPAERERLEKDLMRHGYYVHTAATAAHALDVHEEADLILLGLELSDLDGLELCRVIRSSSDVPIIAVTARSSELDKVLGLQAGADDYVVTPYGLRELLARIEAVMRRARPRRERAAPRTVEHGPLRIDSGLREVTYEGRPVKLTRKEFDLLHLLASHPGTVVSRDDILRRIWGESWSRRTVDTHVSSIRGKLGCSGWIITVRGVGFMIGDGLPDAASG
ncbi:DNA-binding response regulator [Streptomyces spectabilis]|nr:DNA-binding response regulator [Streptomyces spectabilis]